MKKLIIIIIIFVFILLLISHKDEEVRFRVIANSNSYIDQKMKYEVASYLKETLHSTTNLSIIKKEAEYVVSKYNCDYDVNVEIKKQRFDTKYVGDKVYPGGVYKTLVVEIGKAQGKNYWTLLYPEYFNVSFEDVNSGDVEYGWWIIDILKGE